MWRAESLLSQIDYRGRGKHKTTSRPSHRFNPINRSAAPNVTHPTPPTPPPLSRIQRRSVDGDSDDIEVLLNGHYAQVELYRQLFLHKFVEYNALDPRLMLSVWRGSRRLLDFIGSENGVFLNAKLFPRETHILRKRLASACRYRTRAQNQGGVREHLKAAAKEDFNLVAIEELREANTTYVTYLQVQDRAVFDAPFPHDHPDTSKIYAVAPYTDAWMDSKWTPKQFVGPRFLLEQVEIEDPLTRKRLTYRDEQLLFNENLLVPGLQLQNRFTHTTRYADRSLNWSATEEGDAFDETHPKADAAPRSFYTWLRNEKKAFENMWERFHQGDQALEEAPQEQRTVVLHTYKITPPFHLVKGYFEVLDPYYCNILARIKSEFEARSMRLVRDADKSLTFTTPALPKAAELQDMKNVMAKSAEVDAANVTLVVNTGPVGSFLITATVQKTAHERLHEDIEEWSYAEDSLEDGTCRQLLFWHIDHELHKVILDIITEELYGDGPSNITRSDINDGYREIQYKENDNDDDERS